MRTRQSQLGYVLIIALILCLLGSITLGVLLTQILIQQRITHNYEIGGSGANVL